jgi:membrane-associated phospholipid phosphatase
VHRPTRQHLRRSTAIAAMAWLLFAWQLLLIEAFELGDDVIRGNLLPPNPVEAVRHARHLVHLEQAHGLFLEPGVQLWTRHLHAFFGLLSYATIVRVTDVVYAGGQTIIPLLLAVWIFRRHRTRWPLIRTTAFLMVLLCVIGYELYPVAPPRLTSGLSYAGHAFHFQNSTAQVIGNVTLNGIPLGYNAYSAMPSAHIAMALLVAGCVLLLARGWLVRLLAVLYPVLMLFTVIVSGNHYLLDAACGAMAVVLAAVLALALESARRPLVRMALRKAAPDIATTRRSTLHPIRAKEVQQWQTSHRR